MQVAAISTDLRPCRGLLLNFVLSMLYIGFCLIESACLKCGLSSTQVQILNRRLISLTKFGAAGDRLLGSELSNIVIP